MDGPHAAHPAADEALERGREGAHDDDAWATANSAGRQVLRPATVDVAGPGEDLVSDADVVRLFRERTSPGEGPPSWRYCVCTAERWRELELELELERAGSSRSGGPRRALTRAPLAAAAAALLCSALAAMHMLAASDASGTPTDAPATTAAAALALALALALSLVLARWRAGVAVVEESLLVVPNAGIQVEALRRSGRRERRFFPAGAAHRLVLYEAMSWFSVGLHLALVVPACDHLVPVFPTLHPRLRLLRATLENVDPMLAPARA